MRNTFVNSADYLAYLQDSRRKQYLPKDPPKDEFWRITSEEHKQHGMEHLLASPFAGLEWVISDAFAKLLNSLDTKTADHISKRIAVGIVENGTPNAFIAKSPDSHLAIVVHSGLCAFLHKYLKLIRAVASPADVTFCNRIGSGLSTATPPSRTSMNFCITTQRQESPAGQCLNLTRPRRIKWQRY